MKRNNRPLKRRRPYIEPRKRILIVCEGKKTEPSYFDGLRTLERARTVDIEIDNTGGVPKTLVERATAKKRESRKNTRRGGDPNLQYDEIWCVFDVDEHPKLAEAKKQAKDNEIKLAISNPCFELWLILHFRDQRASIDRHPLQSACRLCMPDYVKSVNFNELKSRVDDAVQRAIQLEEWQKGRDNMGQNPSTSVHELVQVIRTNSKDFQLSQIDGA